jgi:Flp pilus assembly protein TadD
VERERSRSLELARHYLDLGRPEQALDALQRGDVDPEDPELFQLRACALFDSGRNSDAATAAREGLARLPESIDLLETLALAELQLGHHEEAERAIDKALKISPWNEVLHAQRALILARNGEFTKARTALEEAVRLNPEATHVLQIRAQVEVLAESDDADAAIEDLLSVDPENRVGHILKGDLAASRNKFGAAARHFGTAARLDPSDSGVTEAAREARVGAHPLLAPVRPMWRFGRWRSYFLYITLLVLLAAAGLESLRRALVVVWLTIVVLSWVGPPVLRRWQRRRYGG